MGHEFGHVFACIVDYDSGVDETVPQGFGGVDEVVFVASSAVGCAVVQAGGDVRDSGNVECFGAVGRFVAQGLTGRIVDGPVAALIEGQGWLVE